EPGSTMATRRSASAVRRSSTNWEKASAVRVKRSRMRSSCSFLVWSIINCLFGCAAQEPVYRGGTVSKLRDCATRRAQTKVCAIPDHRLKSVSLPAREGDDEFQRGVRRGEAHYFDVFQFRSAARGAYVVFGDALLAFWIDHPECAVGGEASGQRLYAPQIRTGLRAEEDERGAARRRAFRDFAGLRGEFLSEFAVYRAGQRHPRSPGDAQLLEAALRRANFLRPTFGARAQLEIEHSARVADAQPSVAGLEGLDVAEQNLNLGSLFFGSRCPEEEVLRLQHGRALMHPCAHQRPRFDLLAHSSLPPAVSPSLLPRASR